MINVPDRLFTNNPFTYFEFKREPLTRCRFLKLRESHVNPRTKKIETYHNLISRVLMRLRIAGAEEQGEFFADTPINCHVT